MSDYHEFLRRKERRNSPAGVDVSTDELSNVLFGFQRTIVAWALKMGRCAIFADTGLGKTLMQLEWARHIGKRVLILAPLAVSTQTANEGRKLDLSVNVCRDASDVLDGINITNYERLEKFDLASFDAVVLDESSIIKSQDGKTRAMLTEQCANVPYRLACTATPSPNDVMELGTHAEFLGAMKHVEMLATYFTHDGGETQKWRLKGHAKRDFWRWVSSWAALVSKPSDLGFSDDGFVLPELRMREHIVSSDIGNDGALFALPAQGLMERRAARRESISARVAQAAAIIANDTDASPWLVWCELNAEADALTAILPNATEIRGPDSIEKKEQALLGFAAGTIPLLVTKPSIAGFGMNWQRCHKMLFVGVSDSFEALYQAIRRCYRFGQTHPVDVHLVLSEAEVSVLQNLKRKERDAQTMRHAMIEAAAEGLSFHRTCVAYAPPMIEVPTWLKTAS